MIVIMTLMGAIASLFFKKASGSNGILNLIKNPNLYVGGFIYVASAGINIYILRFLNYSVVLPMTSITYIWTMVLSGFILKEKISKRKILGVGMIIIGAVMVVF
ncbi:MAG: EamA family transporter [Blautia sp.]|nr:EamA family transporter [Blautia sp.]MCM1200963.1 EamA family transporter [Bacteroides fragilis]